LQSFEFWRKIFFPIDILFFLRVFNRVLSPGRIKGFKGKGTIKEALFMGQALDKGSLTPTVIPEISKEEILKLREKPYYNEANKIIKKISLL